MEEIWGQSELTRFIGKGRLMSINEKFRKTKVFRVAITYLVYVWVLIQVADVIVSGNDLPESLLGNLTTVLIIGFPVVIVSTWIFASIREGRKREYEVINERAPPGESQNIFNWLLIALLVLALAYFATDKFLIEPVQENKVIESAEYKSRIEK